MVEKSLGVGSLISLNGDQTSTSVHVVSSILGRLFGDLKGVGRILITDNPLCVIPVNWPEIAKGFFQNPWFLSVKGSYGSGYSYANAYMGFY